MGNTEVVGRVDGEVQVAVLVTSPQQRAHFMVVIVVGLFAVPVIRSGRVEALIVPVEVAPDRAFLLKVVRRSRRLVIPLLILQLTRQLDRYRIARFRTPIDDPLIKVRQSLVQRILSPIIDQILPSIINRVVINFIFVVSSCPRNEFVH